MARQLIKQAKCALGKHPAHADGFLYQDWAALNAYQLQCNKRLAESIQLEQEEYLSNHPEVIAGLKLLIAHLSQKNIRSEILKQVAFYFIRPIEEQDEEIRNYLNLPLEGSFVNEKLQTYNNNDVDLEEELLRTVRKFNPVKPMKVQISEPIRPQTKSSSFISFVSSASTTITPESVSTPEPTLWEQIYKMVLNILDKVIFARVTEAAFMYDTAYVELMHAVENAMEKPVKEIRNDIANLIFTSFMAFDHIIDMIERIEAEITWEKRMKKKLKKTLRRHKNFKGYETPPTSKSDLSSHESHNILPLERGQCQPAGTFNRYPKDRFGIYRPRKERFEESSVTETPVIFDTNEKKEENRP